MRTPTHRELESSLETYFARVVRERLAGYTMKIAPTVKGAPDRLVILPGARIDLVELKAVDGKVSPAQEYWRDRVGQLGVRVHVLRGRDGVDQWARLVQTGETT